MAIAEAYLGSFRPVGAVPGFESILSNSGMAALGVIPAANAKLAGELAERALSEGGANRRTQMTLDATADQNELIRRENRRTGALRLAGTMLTSALPGTVSVGGVEAGDPLQLMSQLRSYFQGGRQDRAGKMLRTNTALAEMFKS